MPTISSTEIPYHPSLTQQRTMAPPLSKANIQSISPKDTRKDGLQIRQFSFAQEIVNTSSPAPIIFYTWCTKNLTQYTRHVNINLICSKPSMYKYSKKEILWFQSCQKFSFHFLSIYQFHQKQHFYRKHLNHKTNSSPLGFHQLPQKKHKAS